MPASKKPKVQKMAEFSKHLNLLHYDFNTGTNCVQKKKGMPTQIDQIIIEEDGEKEERGNTGLANFVRDRVPTRENMSRRGGPRFRVYFNKQAQPETRISTGKNQF